MEYALVTRKIALPAPRLWAKVREFGGIAAWVAGVTDCRLEGPGDSPGTVRLVSLGAKQVREQLLILDEQRMRLSYAVLPPHVLPIADVESTMIVEAVAEQEARVSWSSRGRMDAPNPPLTAAIEHFFSSSLARLEQLCQTESA